MKREQTLGRRVKRLTTACFFMCLFSGGTILFMFDRFDLPSMSIKGGVTLTTFYLVYLRNSTIEAKRKLHQP